MISSTNDGALPSFDTTQLSRSGICSAPGTTNPSGCTLGSPGKYTANSPPPRHACAPKSTRDPPRRYSSGTTMGLEYYAFACSLDEFASVYGSRDRALWDAISASPHRDVRARLGLDEPPSYQRPQGLQALHDIFRGAAFFRERSHVYAFAHMTCAWHLGRPLGVSLGSYGRHAALMSYLSDRGEPDDDPFGLVNNLAWPLPDLPPIEDWPALWAFTADEVRQRAAAIAACTRRLGDAVKPDDDSAWSLYAEMAGYFADCARTGDALLVVAS